MFDIDTNITKVVQLDALRPAIHQHVSLLIAGGLEPEAALAVAATVAALVYSDLMKEALAQAILAIGDGTGPSVEQSPLIVEERVKRGAALDESSSSNSSRTT
jgi:hypothetical protein